MARDTQGLETRVIHVGEGQDADAAPLTTPVYQTATFVFESADDVAQYGSGGSRKYLYSRYRNPTVAALEAKLAALEGAEAALAFSSGMAATATAFMALVRGGDEVVCPAPLYGGTAHLLQDLLARFDVSTRVVGLDDLFRLDDLLTERTKVFWFESPINPHLRCIDIEAMARACRHRGVICAFDNTFASPMNQQPLALGADLVMHSASKYLGGHADITAGVIAGSQALVDRVSAVRRLLGTVLDPQPAYTLARSVKTLAVRMQRHNENAGAVAEWLSRDARVGRVFYPGLPSHPDHAIARRQMRGFGGMVCLDLDGSFERASRVFDRLQVFRRAASLGGVESLCSMPVLTSHTGFSDEALAQAGVTRGMLRLSVGLEDAADLIADLDAALGG